jgi:hypothetical protein
MRHFPAFLNPLIVSENPETLRSAEILVRSTTMRQNPLMIRRYPRLLLLSCALILAVLFLAVPSVRAQQPPPSVAPPQPQAEQPSSPPPQSNAGEQEKQKAPDETTREQRTGTSDDRLFWTLPNFLTVDSENIPRLSAGAKFKVVARSAFDYVEFPWYAFLSGLSQAENSEPGYGQGAAGYGKRFGAAIADGTIENFMTAAVLPSILKQDPRYYQLGKGGFWHRTTYAVSRILVTRSDAGTAQFNFSEVFGSAISAGISTYSYHPRSDRTVDNTLKVWGTQVGYDTLTLVVKEFWPDIRRHFRKK